MKKHRIILRFLKEHAFSKKLFLFYIMTIIIIIINTILLVMRPIYQSKMVDLLSLQMSEKKEVFFLDLAIFLVILFASYSIMYLLNYIMDITSEEIALSLRQDTAEKIGKIPSDFFSNHDLSYILLKIDKDIESIKQCGIVNIIKLISNIMTIAVIVPYMFRINVYITLGIVVLLVLIPIFSKMFGKYITKYSEQVLDYHKKHTGIIKEIFDNWMMIRLLGCFEYIYDKYEKINIGYKQRINKQNKLYTLNAIITIMFQLLGTAIIWGIGGQEVLKGNMTIGVILALMNYQSIIMSPILELSVFSNEYHTVLVSLQDIYEFLGKENIETEGKAKVEQVKTIELKNMGFQYENQETLFSSVNLRFEKGNIYAIKGESGKGKSTLFKIIVGILEPTTGIVNINQYNIKELNLYEYWKQIGYSIQTPTFFTGSIFENLNISESKRKQDILQVCIELDIYEEIMEMEKNLSTIIGSEVSNLSSGQARRLDIARFVLRDAPILILDEPTANIDANKRKKFFATMRKIAQEKIIIISSHNEEDFANMDKIYEIKNNRVEEIV
jgi:ABC-type multidrug transport system, ATPase and permease components